MEVCTHISNNISNKNGWMSGNIGNIGDNGESRCSVILSPVQTWATLGRKMQNSVAGFQINMYWTLAFKVFGLIYHLMK